MARVNVETRALAESRLRMLMKLMNWNRREAVGTLVLLWHDSQELEKVVATKEEILMWCDCLPKEEDKLLKALLACPYISMKKMPDGRELFAIRGNAKHVQALRLRKQSSQVAGKASAKARNFNKIERDVNDPFSVAFNELNDPLTICEPNAIQCNAIQSNSKQSNATHIKDICEKETSKPKVSGVSAFHPLAVLWNTNCGSLPKVREMNSKRKRNCELRWKEHPEESYWLDVIRGITSSDFCTGKNNNSWRADFDFLLRPGTSTRVLEGTYGGSSKRSGPAADARTLELFGT